MLDAQHVVEAGADARVIVGGAVLAPRAVPAVAPAWA